MVSKVVILAAALAVVYAQESHGHAVSSQYYTQVLHHHPAPKIEHHEEDRREEERGEEAPMADNEHHYPYRNYEYSYDVKDPHTHDVKSQREHREGDVVKGEYSVHQPDGVIRTVKYHSDHKGGFHADVSYSHPTHHT